MVYLWKRHAGLAALMYAPGHQCPRTSIRRSNSLECCRRTPCISVPLAVVACCGPPDAFLDVPPLYHQRDPFRFQAMPGAVNITISIPPTSTLSCPVEQAPTSVAAGEMIAYLMPMEDVRVDLVVEEVSEAEIDRVNFTKRITARPLLFNRKRNKLKDEETSP